MKLYSYNNFLNESKEHSEIHSICERYRIENYSINSDGTIDVDGGVYLQAFKLSRLPLKFNRVEDYFNCAYNKLTSLDGCPNTIMGNFYCHGNDLRDFEGFPEFYDGNVYFHSNPIEKVLNPIPYDKRVKFIHLINEYDVIRNKKTIIGDRLAASYEGVGVEFPENIKIEGYEII